MNASFTNCSDEHPLLSGLVQAEQPELLRSVGLTILVSTVIYVVCTLLAYGALRDNFPLCGRQHSLVFAGSILGTSSLLMNSAIIDGAGWQVVS